MSRFEDIPQAHREAHRALDNARCSLDWGPGSRSFNPEELLEAAQRLVAAAQYMVDEGERLYGTG